MKKYLVLALFTFYSFSTYSQIFPQWTKNFTSLGGDENANKSAVDAFGNLYIIGSHRGTKIGNITLETQGDSDILLIKMNSAGVVQWAKRAGGDLDDKGFGIAVSSAGIFVTGTFKGIVNFNTPFNPGTN